jgi:hypothetical protein
MSYLSTVILGLDPRIQEVSKPLRAALDRRVKPGDDNEVRLNP